MTVVGFGLSLPRLPVTAAGADTPASRLGALLPWLPRDALTLALLTVFSALLVLALTLRRALPSAPHTKRLAFALPSHTQALAWGRNALIRLVDLLEDDEETAEEEQRRRAALATININNNNNRTRSPPPDSKPPRTFTIGGAQYRLPSAAVLPPKSGPRPTQRGVPLASPPAPQLSFGSMPPPVQVELPRRPLSAAKLIMSRHSIRKPYRSPPVPGAPRTTPCSRLASSSETASETS